MCCLKSWIWHPLITCQIPSILNLIPTVKSQTFPHIKIIYPNTTICGSVMIDGLATPVVTLNIVLHKNEPQEDVQNYTMDIDLYGIHSNSSSPSFHIPHQLSICFPSGSD